MAETATCYRPSGPTTRSFHLSDSKRRVMVGPIRSGTSVACCIELIRRIMATPAHHGVRRSRWAVLRQTYGDLKRTTIKTWNEWAEPVFGSKPIERVEGIVQEVGIELEDGTRVEAEVNFFSLTDDRAIDKLLSLELTGGFINEVRQFSKPLIDAFDDRVGHYPAKRNAPDGVWFGWWADTNPPDRDHWIHQMFEEEDAPRGWSYFRQPGALIRDGRGGWAINPKAENLDNLNGGADFYLDGMSGKGEAHIAVYYGAEFGFADDGRRVIGDYDDMRHVADKPIAYDRSNPSLYVGIDFGATPAAFILQEGTDGWWYGLEELLAEKVGVGAFAKEQLAPRLQTLEDNGFDLVITGDPAGGGTSETDGKTAFKALEDAGIHCEPAYSNKFGMRCEVLGRLCRQDRFKLSPACKVTRRGLAQKYIYRRIGSGGEGAVYQERPDKNEFSHSVDALIYGLMGAGEGRDIGVSA